MLQAIFDRRSIRNYQETPLPKEMIETILKAGILAPSSKNRQPWEFIVVSGDAKVEMLAAMEQGLAREKENPLLPDSSPFLSGAVHTLSIMKQAPVTIFIVNTLGIDLDTTLNAEQRIFELCNAQSIGAAIENMTLAATELGLGSLWICDTYFAFEELNSWLGCDGQLIAALTLGYPNEAPSPRPRKSFCDVVQWRDKPNRF